MSKTMPSTFTFIALDRLLEPRAPTSVPKSIITKPTPPPPPPDWKKKKKLERRHSSSSTTETKQTGGQFLPQLSPALYATPAVTPVPDSPSSFPPSPYIINHKRRGPRLLLLKSVSQNDDVSLNHQQPPPEGEGEGEGVTNTTTTTTTTTVDDENGRNPVCSPHKEEEETGQNYFRDDEDTRGGSSNLLDARLVVRTEDSSSTNLERYCEGDEDFFDPRETMSFTSINNDVVEDNSVGERSFTFTSQMVVGEYYDALEELSSEGGPQSSLRDMDAELREIRLNLLTEMEERKKAEETLKNMQKQWQKAREQLSLVGLTIPAASTIAVEDGNLDLDPGEELCQQIYIARMVSDSVGRGAVRAEVEMEMESWIESKNFEIARLSDRLQYYEAVNHEMSQRNQEAVEVARRQRHRRKRLRRWVWSSIGTAVAIGAVALAWTYLPTGRESSCSMPSQALDGDDATKP